MSDRLPPFSIDITPDSVCRWLVGRDGDLPARMPSPGDPVPMSYLFFLRSQPATATSIHTELGRDPDRGLFGGVVYERARGAWVGDSLQADAVVTERKSVESPRGDMRLTTLVNRWNYGGDTAVTENVRMVDLPPGPPSPPAAGPDADPDLSAIGEPVAFTRKQVAWLTVETGDLNPLHVDRTYAESRLFPDVVVPGTLIVPIVEKTLESEAGAPLRLLDVRFRAPTYPDEEIVVRALEDGDGAWRFEVSGGGQVRAFGKAAVATDV